MRHTLSDGVTWIDVLPLAAIKAKHKDAVDAAIKLYVAFDDKGQPDLSNMPITMSIAKAQRNVLMAVCILRWSVTTVDMNEDGEPIEGTERALEVPVWHADGAQGFIEHEDSFGELDIDIFNELEDYFAPYMEKVRRRPDPKGTTTASSNATSKAKESHSRKG